MLLRRFDPGITFKCSQREQTSQAMIQIVLLEENILFQCNLKVAPLAEMQRSDMAVAAIGVGERGRIHGCG
jgi:hypothetical protein